MSTQDIDRHTFFNTLNKRNRKRLKKMMIHHCVDIKDVRHIRMQGKDVIYTLFESNDDGHRYLDKNDEVAIRYERHPIPF